MQETKELLHLFKLLAAPATSYCVLCLRTGSQRRVIEENSLNSVLAALNDEEVWPWKHAEDKNMRVCYICEARLVSMMEVIELIRSGVMADRLLQCYKKKELIGICSKTNQHPLKSSMAACVKRLRALSSFSNLSIVAASCINITSEPASFTSTQIDPMLSAPAKECNTTSLPQTSVTSGRAPNKNLAVTNQGITTLDPTPQNTLPDPSPGITATGLTTPATSSNYSLPFMQNIPQTVKVTDTLTITNSGKYLALKTPGESVVLHAIYQGTDGKSYVPTLSVMIVGGQLLPMPDFGLKKVAEKSSSSVSSLPEIGISLPGLETILSTSGDEPQTNSIQDYARIKPLGLQSRSVPVSQISDSNHQTSVANPNSRFTPILPRVQKFNPRGNISRLTEAPLSQINAERRKFLARGIKPPRCYAESQPNSRLPHFKNSDLSNGMTDDATYLDENLLDEELPNENLIDISEEETIAMEDDPLQQNELVAGPLEIETESETDSAPESDLNADTSLLQNMFVRKPLSFERPHSTNKRTNVEKALARIDLINNNRKPLVKLIPLNLDNITTVNLKKHKWNVKIPQDFCLKRHSYNKDLLSKSKKFISSQVSDIASNNAGIVKITPSKNVSIFRNKLNENRNNANPERDIGKSEQLATVILSDTDSDGEEKSQPVQNVVKNPKLIEDYTMDWEDKIPMDVITYMDASDPTVITKDLALSYHPAEPTTDGSALGIIVDAYSERERSCIQFDD